MSQVHKENLTAVDNALPNRAGLDIEIFGMEGVPEDIVQQHTQRVLTNFHQTLAERQAAGGGAAQGGSNASAPKKPKLEDVSDIKKRLAGFKAAKLAAEKGGNSGSTTPTPSAPSQSQPQATTVCTSDNMSCFSSSSDVQAASPTYPSYQSPYAAPPTNGSYSQSPSFAQPPASAAPAPYQAQPAFPPAVSPVQVGGYGQLPTAQLGQPGYGGQVPPVSYAQTPYAQPPQPSFQPQR